MKNRIAALLRFFRLIMYVPVINSGIGHRDEMFAEKEYGGYYGE